MSLLSKEVENIPGEQIKAIVSDLTENTVSQSSPVYLGLRQGSWESSSEGRKVNISPLSTCL